MTRPSWSAGKPATYFGCAALWITVPVGKKWIEPGATEAATTSVRSVHVQVEHNSQIVLEADPNWSYDQTDPSETTCR
jgi:hypothetical protein